MLLAAFSAARLLFALPAGLLADSTSTGRAPYRVGLVFLVTATLMFAFAENLIPLFVSRVLQGMSAAIIYTTGLAMGIDTVGSKKLGRTLGTVPGVPHSPIEPSRLLIISQLHSFIAVGKLIAPPLAGALYARTGYAGVLGVSVTILAVDFLMRVSLIEKKTAAAYHLSEGASPISDEPDAIQGERGLIQHERLDDFQATEEDSLLPIKTCDRVNKRDLSRVLPILGCLGNSRLLVSLTLDFLQALIIGTHDAALTTEAAARFGLSSLDTGVLFLALSLPNLILAVCG